MTRDWVEELADVEPDVASDGYAVAHGERHGGVRVDGRARDLAAVVDGAVSSYNASVAEEDEVEYALDERDELVVPDRLYREMRGEPGEALVTFEDDDALERYDLVVPTGGESGAFRAVGEELVDRYVTADGMPDELADDLRAAVDGHLMQGTMLYVGDEPPRTGTDALARQAGGHDEGVSLLYREER